MNIKYIFKYKIPDIYYAIIWSIRNFFSYFKIVSQMRPWDYQYILIMQKFQLEQLCNQIEKYGHEIDKDRLPRIEKMKRAIELLNNIIEDNYADRCGYNSDAIKMYIDEKTKQIKWEKQPGYDNYNSETIFNNADKLKIKEWDELFEILKNNLQGWWD